MSYTHYQVADISSEVKPVATSALEAFLVELQKVMPSLKFAYRRSHEVHAYMDGCPYTLGILGFDSSDSRYYVYARGIDNNKYTSGKRERYTMWSKDRKVALRNAKKFLRPYTVDELARVSGDTAREHINAVRQKTTTLAMKLRNQINHAAQLLPELRHLIESGHTFLNPDFDHTAREWVKVQTEVDSAAQDSKTFTFVHVTSDWLGQVLKTRQMEPVKGTYIYTLRPKGDTLSQIVPIGEADQTLVGRISVLSMLNPNTYVDGVGYRASEDMFYVET